MSLALAWAGERTVPDISLIMIPILLGCIVGLALCLVLQRRRTSRLVDTGQSRDFALQERQKELSALGAIVRVTSDMQLPVRDLIANVVKELPAGFTYPEDLAVRLTFNDLVIDWLDPSRIDTPLEIPVEGAGRHIGSILVGYVTPKPDLEDGPFWLGERQLLSIIAQRLASIDVRKRTSAMLEQSEARFRAIFESSILPSAVDEAGVFSNANAAALRSFGVADLGQMIGRTPGDFSPEFQPDGRRSSDVIAEVIKRVLEQGFARFDWVFRRADGTEFMADVVLSAVHLEHRTITLSVWNDVTALREAEATVAQYNEKLAEEVALRTADLARLNREFATILDTASSGVALLRDMIVQRCNPALCQIFGMSETDILGNSFAALCLDETVWQSCSRQAAGALAKGETFSVEHELQRPDGTLFWARMRARTIDPAHPDLGSVWVVDDISAEVAARAEMAEARRLAEEAAEVKARFLANMSHEIRTPLNAVLGFSAILKDTGMTAQQASFLDKITVAGKHLLMIINDILDFSKVEAGKLAIEQVDLSLNETVRSAIDMVLSRATEKNLEIIVDVDPALPDGYRGDPLRIGQILVNFLSNAVKFTERGEILVCVSGERAANGQETLSFSVTDTGIGMTPDQIDRLFQSFAQADASTTRVHGGTGLGLAISRALAELMGGQLSVVSAPGQGSTLQLTLTLPARGEAGAPDRPLDGRRVLIVDDNPRALAAAARLLAAMGGAVASAADTAAALVQLGAGGGPFDLALIDEPMPEAAELVARLGPACRVLRMTALETASLAQPDAGGRALDILRKPLDPRDLRRILSGVDQAEPPAPPPIARAKTLTGRKILVVDDNLLNQEVAAALLRQKGAEVALAENGAVAVQAVQDRRFDLVLMDIQMPVMDGIAATRAIRALTGEAAKVPILAVTASAEPEAKGYALQAGMNDIVVKPCPPAEFERVILRWLPTSAQPEVGADPEAAVPPDLAAFSVVDAARGLALSGGSEALYRRLLRRFLDDQANFSTVFHDARLGSDPRAAERLAHSLKSSAAQIGAQDLAEAAARLETAAHAGDGAQIDALLPAVSARLAEVCLDLATLAPAPDEAAGNAAPLSFAEAAAQLAPLLEHGAFDVVRVFENLGPALQAGFAPQDWSAFCRAIEGFDLPAALKLLRQQMGRADGEE